MASSKNNEKQPTVCGPLPRCNGLDCPLKDTPHSKGIYLHDGKPAPKQFEASAFEKSNPPPEIKREGTMHFERVLVPLPLGVILRALTMRGPKYREGECWSGNEKSIQEFDKDRDDIRAPREKIVRVMVNLEVEGFDLAQQGFLKYHRGCECEKCGCSNLGGCKCLWENGCIGKAVVW